MEDLDRALELLQHRKDAWARLPVGTKIEYLLSIRDHTRKEAERWVDAAVAAKSIPADSPLAGEEWISGPWAVLYAINRYISTLRQIKLFGSPQLPDKAVHERDGGQVVVDVFPVSVYDRVLLGGVSAQVWMQPGVTHQNLQATLGVFYQKVMPKGAVALVLGAGNIASIPPLDVLYKLLADGHVCILKMNPVNAYLGPILESIFAQLISGGYLQIVYGSAQAGAYLSQHKLVDEIHITGSERTYYAIVKDLPSPKPITSELGNVSPTIVVPGDWTDADYDFQAQNIVTQKMHNGGFNCVASQVLVLPRDWEGTPKLLAAIERVMRTTSPRVAYYPGASDRQRALSAGHPGAKLFDTPSATIVPRTILHVDAATNDPSFSTEAFASVLALTQLAGGALEFLANAVAFTNNRLRGTLGANIIIHPTTESRLGHIFDRAIAALRYGCVAINCWTGVGYFIAETSWGAYPGHTPADIQSGIGVVHNSHFFSKSQKSVVRASFYPFPRGLAHGSFALLPRPPWFITNKTAARTGRALCEFEANPSVLRALPILASALRG